MITDIDALYFRWLMDRFDNPSPGLERVCLMLFQNIFQRRVGNDVNRSIDGRNLRVAFLDDWSEANIDPRISNLFLEDECNWLEMLVALSFGLDYLYDGGVKENFVMLLDNLGLAKLMTRAGGRYKEIDQQLVDQATNRVDHNLFDPDGNGGLFPLTKNQHPDQREVEIWDQCAAYFRERLEGVLF